MKKSFLPLSITAMVLAACSASATLVVYYEFDDPVGTTADAVSNAGTSNGIIAAMSPGIGATDGLGNLVISGDPLRENYFLGSASPAAGIQYYRIDFSTVGGNSFFGVRVRDEANSNNLLHDVNVGGSVNINTSGTWTWLQAGGLSASSASFIIETDIDADTFSVYHDIGLTGTYTVYEAATDLGFGAPIVDGAISQVNALTLDAGSGSIIDRIALGDDWTEISTLGDIGAIPEPSAFALLGGFAALGIILRRRR